MIASLIVAQIVLPLVLITWFAIAPPRNLLGVSLQALGTAIALFAIAIISSLVNFSYLGYVLVIRAFYQGVQPGWATMSFQNATMFGLLFFIVAIICEYLARLLDEVKVRPLYFIEDEIQSSVMLANSEMRNVVYSERDGT